MRARNGGFVATDDDALFARMKKLKMQGMDNIFESDLYQLAGFNLKYTDILASVGLVQLNKIYDKVSASREHYAMYVNALKESASMHFLPTREDEVIYTPDLVFEDAKTARRYLENQEIQVRPAGACLHTADYFIKRTDYRNAEFFEKHLLYMPGGPDQPKENIQTVIRHLKEL